MMKKWGEITNRVAFDCFALTESRNYLSHRLYYCCLAVSVSDLWSLRIFENGIAL